MVKTYDKAYKEIFVIINYLPKSDFEKIPNNVIKMFEAKMDKDYEYDLDKNKPFEHQEMLEETREILAVLYKRYFATEKEKEIIENCQKKAIFEKEEQKQEKFKDVDIFANNKKCVEINAEEEIKPENLPIVNENLKWYEKVVKFFTNIFKKR